MRSIHRYYVPRTSHNGHASNNWMGKSVHIQTFWFVHVQFLTGYAQSSDDIMTRGSERERKCLFVEWITSSMLNTFTYLNPMTKPEQTNETAERRRGEKTFETNKKSKLGVNSICHGIQSDQKKWRQTEKRTNTMEINHFDVFALLSFTLVRTPHNNETIRTSVMSCARLWFRLWMNPNWMVSESKPPMK